MTVAVPGGPSVVAIGGGHGLSASLRAARRYAGSITAVVSVADDGGSSGRLREALPGLPAPGDVRRCLAALAEDDSPFGRILEHRFGEGELAGHALGNLLLVSLAHEMGSFPAAVDEVAARVGAVGRVLPATVDAVALVGIVDGRPGVEPIVGQVAVQNTEGVCRLRLSPEAPASPPEVAAAILAADQVVLGPGSLFTSVLAAAIAPAVREALAETHARRVLVANLAPQLPETAGMSVADELEAMAEHGIEVDVVLVDPRRGCEAASVPVVAHRVAEPAGAVHDPALLADALARLAVRRLP